MKGTRRKYRKVALGVSGKKFAETSGQAELKKNPFFKITVS